MKSASDPVVHLTSRAAYFAIKITCSDRNLIGAIEKPQGQSTIVYLNAKDDLISAAGGNFRRVPGFVPASHGHMHNGAGSGFAGYRKFTTLAAALNVLGVQLNLVWCDPITRKELELTARGYRHQRLKGTEGGSTYTNDRGDVVVTVRPPKRPLTATELDHNCRRLRDAMAEANRSGPPVRELHIASGGEHPLPDWFTDWCRANGIKIVVHKPERGPVPDFEP